MGTTALSCLLLTSTLVPKLPAVSSTEPLWWSRTTLEAPGVPPKDSWTRNEIDRFVLKELVQRKLEPSQPASPLTLVRRLTYDLTGLPPTPDEIDEFLSQYAKDPEPAYEQLVDRLLASPRYGERFARHWLDVAKYADTCGYDKDKLRPNAWPYRDYVIRSFNEDKPYAQFVKEQVAGDALYPGQPDGILGLGFLAAGPWDFIGHAEVPESKIDGKVARNLDRDDMVSNVFNTFCAVTIQCARCHEHKGDPIGQEHYYSLQSIFAAVDKADREFGVAPETERQKNVLQARVKILAEKISKAESTLKAKGGERLSKLDKQILKLQKSGGQVVKGPEHGYHSLVVKSPGTRKWVQVDLGNKVELRKVVLHASHDNHNSIGAGFGFPVRFKVIASNREDFSRSQVLIDRSKKDFVNPGLLPVELSVRSSARFLRIEAIRLAKRSNDYIFALDELRVLDEQGLNLAEKKKVTALDSIEAPNRWTKANLTDGKWAKSMSPANDGKLAGLRKERQSFVESLRSPAERESMEKSREELKKAETKLSGLPRGEMVYTATTHFKPRGNFKPTNGKPRMIRVLHRGEVTQPKEEVRPGVFPLFGDEPWQFDLPEVHDESARRAALAEWIVRKDHPLTWRTIANRIWQWHFGEPIVGSPNDFGPLGREPTHPELLDWLALSFRDSGGSFKKLHKLIAMSATYRQSSLGNEAKAKTDSSNQFLWRMNRRKLSAEEIRDSVLAVSGKLNLEMGGPGYYLFALEKTAHSPHYEYHKFNPEDAKSHRRSVYRFIVRSQPNPFMTTLDCADSSQSTPKRNETLTALQALSLLNNKFSLAMARHFATRLEKEAKGIHSQARLGHKLVTGRYPNANELTLLVSYGGKHGLQNLCRALYNLSEFSYLD
jgi:hypothetical protein